MQDERLIAIMEALDKLMEEAMAEENKERTEAFDEAMGVVAVAFANFEDQSDQ